MKKIFSFVLLLGISVAAMAQKSALEENFTGSKLPSGWNQAGKFWSFSEGEAKAFAGGAPENAVDTLFSPMVDILGLENHPTITIGYQLIEQGNIKDDLTLLYRTSQSEGWTALKELGATTGTEEVMIELPESVKANVQVAIAAKYNTAQNYARVDYLLVENKTEATVALSDFAYSNLSSTGFDLTWGTLTTKYFSGYNLKISTEPMTDMSAAGNVKDEVLQDQAYSVSGVKPNTMYYAYVQYDCGDGDVSPWASLEIKTECAAVSAPYSDDFESGWNSCYTIISESKKQGINGEYPCNSTKSLCFWDAKGANTYFYLPQMADDVTKYQISFMAASDEDTDTYGRTITIGVGENTEATSFVELKTLTLPKGRKWEKITFSLAGYKGTGRYIGLRGGNADKANHIYIDDLKIEAVSACPMPMFVAVSKIASTQAEISWEEAGTASEWNLVVAQKPYADPMDCEAELPGEFAGSVTTNPYTITNLAPSTTYYVYVQSGCAEGEWTNVVSFTTGKPVSFPFAEKFDRFEPEFYLTCTSNKDLPEGWVGGDRGMNPLYARYYDAAYTSTSSPKTYWPYVGIDKDHTDGAYQPAALVLKGTSISATTPTSSTGYGSYVMMPKLPVATLNDKMIRMWVYSANAVTIKVGTAKTPDVTIPQGEMFAGATPNVSELNDMALVGSTEWQLVELPLTKWVKANGDFITIWLLPGTSTPTVYVDDIEVVNAPSCMGVKGPKAEVLDANNIQLTWEENLSATSWKVKVSTTELANPATDAADVVSTTVSVKTYKVTGLNPNTKYFMYVTPVCGNNWKMVSATTERKDGLMVPYYNDFSTETTGAVVARGPLGWKLGNVNVTAALGTQTNIPYVYNTDMTGGPAIGVNKPNLYFYHTNGATSTGAYAIMPELVNADIKDLVMNFVGYYNNTTRTGNYSGGLLRIGVIADPKNVAKDFSNVTKIATVYCSANKICEKFVVDFSGYKGSDKYIIFYSDTAKYNNFMLDNLTISKSTDPQAVSDLAISAINQSGATIAWKENGKATKWNIKVFGAAVADPDTETPVVEYKGVTTKSKAITGLQHSTEYYVYVQSSQSNGNGMWASTSFYTECGAWALPFLETFDQYATGGTSSNTLHPCYNISASTSNPYVRMYSASAIATNHTTGGKDGNVYYMTAGSGKVAQLELPKFNKHVNKLQMTVYATNYSSYVGDNTITYIGVVTSDGVFHKVTEKTVPTAKVWEEWFVDFSVYDGADGVIAIRQDYAATGKAKTLYAFLDDILVEEIPMCSKIATVEIDDITDGGATINWVKAADETAWNLKVSTTELDDPSEATADAFDGLVTVNSKTLTGLLDNQNYYVYVQAVNPAKECVGAWSTVRTFKTLCKPVALPLYLDFEEYEAVNIIPDCSTISGDEIAYGTASTNTLAGVGTCDGSAYKVRVYSAKDKSNYWALPKLDVVDIRKVAISMQMTGSTSTYSNLYSAIWHPFEIGVMTDPSDPSTFVAVVKDSLNGLQSPAVWSEHAYELTNYVGDDKGNMGKYIAIHPLNNYSINKSSGARSESGCYLYIDNILIEEIPDCASPKGLNLSENWGDSIVLAWDDKQTGVSYEAIVMASADAVPGVDTPVATATSAEKSVKLTGLNTNTVYYAYVRTLCGAKGESAWSNAFKFRSECGEGISLPYYDTFEGLVSGNPVPCWGQITSTYTPEGAPSSAATTLTATVSTTYKKDGAASLKVDCNSNKSAKAITPILKVASLKDVMVYFDAYSTAAAKLVIEAVSDGSEDAEAIPLVSVDVPKSTWKFYTIDLGAYYTSAQPYKQIRFLASAATVYLDNLGITTEKDLYFPVSELKCDQIGDTYFKYSFVESTDLQNWVVEYGESGFELGTGAQKNITETSGTLTGLKTNTSYDMYVKGNKSGATWVGPLTVKTSPKATTLPYYEGFENAATNAEWMILNGTANGEVTYPNQWVIADGAGCDATGNALYIAYEGEYGYWSLGKSGLGNAANAYVWAYRAIEFPENATYNISMKVKSEGPLTESTYDKFDVELVPAGYTMNASNIKRPDGTNATTTKTNAAYNEFNIVPSMQHQTDWTWVNARIDVKTPGIYYLVLYWQNYSTAVAGKPAAVDSIMIEEYPCSEVTNMRYTALSDESATVVWDAGKCEDFEVVVSKYRMSPRPTEMDAEDILVHKEIKGRQIALTNLLPSTTYAVYVRTICPEGRTAWVEFDVTTHCGGETTPYTETFTEKPGCWELGKATVSTHKYLTDDMKNAGIDAETWSYMQIPADGMVILPEFELPIKQLGIKIGAYNSSTAHARLTIGVVDNTYAPETFEQVAILVTAHDFGTLSSSAGNAYVVEEFEKYLNSYKGTGKHIAIRSDLSVYVKYVSVYELPSCVTPQQVEVTDITPESAKLHWLTGAESQWQILVDETDTVVATEEPFVLTGLKQGMEYSVRVRAVCGAEDESEWSLPVSFLTDCEMGELPIIETFEGQKKDNRAVASCWENMRTDEPYASNKTEYNLYKPVKSEYFNKMWSCNWLSALGDYNQLTSQDCASSSSVSDRKYKWFISPKMEFDGSAIFSFDMRYCNNKGEMLEKVGAGRFMVIYSEDGGETWTKDTIFDLSAEDGLYHTHSLDISEFKGKTLRVAFYHEGITNKLSEYTYILIDNVRFNCSATYNYEDHVCEGYDYEGNGFEIPNAEIPAVGGSKTYERFAPGMNGCDSTVYLTLTTLPTLRDTTTVTICEGDSYEWGGRTFTEATETPYPVRGTDPETGCDLISYLTVKVMQQAEPIVVNKYINYTQLPYLYNEANNLYVPVGTLGEYRDTIYTDAEHCQKTQYLITVMQNEITYVDHAICEGDSYAWGGKTLTEEGLYYDTLTNTLGADSIVALNLAVNKLSYTEISDSFCEGTTYSFGGKQLDAAGIYKDTTYYENGCLNLVTTLTLSMREKSAATLDITICAGTDYVVFGHHYSESGSYTITGTNVAGCDSVVTLNLTVTPAIEQTEYAYICTGSSYLDINTGRTYTQAGKYTDSLQTAEGCDSIYTLVLMAADPKLTQLEDTICAGESYEFNGQTLTTTGNYSVTLDGQFCDSIVSLALYVEKYDTIVMSEVITVDELPLTYKDAIVIPAGTAPGIYTDTIVLAGVGEGCGTVLVGTVEIKMSEDVRNVEAETLMIRPNYISVGESVTIDWNMIPSGDITVDVYDVTGKLVTSFEPKTNEPIVISEFHTVGVYTIKLTVGDSTRVGRVMVK